MENNGTILFLMTTLMELATLVCAYLGCRLYNQSRLVRMLIICIPLVLNALLYAVYRTTPFFYLGVILLICIPFAWTRTPAIPAGTTCARTSTITISSGARATKATTASSNAPG